MISFLTRLSTRLSSKLILSCLTAGVGAIPINYVYNDIKPIDMTNVIFNTDENGTIQSAMINLGDPKYGPYHLWWNNSTLSNEKFKWYIEFIRKHPVASRVHRKLYPFELPVCEAGSHFGLHW